MTSILYCGWVGRGNLGDDYMWQVFQALCKEHVQKGLITLTPTSPGTHWRRMEEGVDVVVLGGGSVIDEYYMNFAYRAAELKIPVFVWGSGMDRIGAEGLEALLNEGHFDPSDHLSEELRAKLKAVTPKAKSFAVRGPLTQAIMKTMFPDQEKILISGDPGLLINDRQLFEHRNKNQNQTSKKLKPIIAVNWGTTYNRIYGENEQSIRKQLAEVLQSLCDEGYELILYSVWKEDNRTIQLLRREINRDTCVRVYLNPSVEEVLHLLPECEYSINFKLHANILSLAAGVPCMALGYRFKVYDFFHSIGLPQLILPSQGEEFKTSFLKLHHYLLSHRKEIASVYENYEHIYKEKLIREFHSILTPTSTT
ncbi:polysaccharide pyruvyl transferase family protein [Halobacillus yeomjeoni]|uniref:Polysaccharide pyruvyl transferase family protein n=1 Tax=Halobacillus yeomjeoni TaxID=311194 RepID=A0A931HSV6_9BACI|nr:polysaccharide pyruvyl transferase family protein [Halobacillus yeomjeoni]MBH0228846.1 polysaccharide pyruvyl transferase family protein [Halobacillus yeomjeoni]